MIIGKKWKRAAASLSLGLCVCLLVDPILLAQVVPPKSVRDQRDEKLVSLSFRDAPIQVVLDHYAEITGRTMIQSPGIPAVLLTLKGQEKLTESEFLVALESVLAMNNIALVPMGEKFMKVVPSAELGTHGRGIRRHNEITAKDRVNPASDTLQSRIIELKHLELSEVLPILEGIKHAYAKIQPLERANGMLINETAGNLERMLEIIEFLDVPIETKVETRIYELAHADAAQVASRLNELIQQAQSEQDQAANRRQNRNIRRVARAGQRSDQTSQNRQSNATQSEVELAARGIVQGEVKIVSDERTNILIVISRPENFTFFDRIVTILDKSIEPNLTLEVVALEFGDAADIAGILNDFVGAATADAQSRQGASGNDEDGQDRSAGNRATALQEFVRSRRQARQRAGGSAATQGEGAIDEIGQLSENTRILSDQRTNSLLLMGRRQDIVALRQVIGELDVMLAQVLIEAVILEVNLNDSVETGIDWLQRSFTVSNDETLGPGGGLTVSEPILGFGGGQQLTGSTFTDGSQIDRDNAPNLLAPGALTYYATFFDLNLDAVIRLASTESDARILSTPVIVTTDNTEASILVGESRPVVTSTSTTAGGVARNTFQYQEIGISLNVTPRINPQNFVVMEVTQTADNVGGFEVIDGNNVPIITRRELQAQIAVEDRATIVLGGLVSSDGQDAATKIPLLGDIPLLGKLFRSTTDSNNETELLVLITPYVMSTPVDVARETTRLRDRSFADSRTWEGTWSDSKLLQSEAGTQTDIFAPQPLNESHQPQGILAHNNSKEVVPRGVFGKRETDEAKQGSPVRVDSEDELDHPNGDDPKATKNALHGIQDSVDDEIVPTETVEPEDVTPSKSSPWRKIPKTSPERSKRPAPSNNHDIMEELLRPAPKDTEPTKPTRQALPDLRELHRSNPPVDTLPEPSIVPEIPKENGETKAKPPLAAIDKEGPTPVGTMISTASEYVGKALGDFGTLANASLAGDVALVARTETVHLTKKESLFSQMASVFRTTKNPEVKASPNTSEDRQAKAGEESEPFLALEDLVTPVAFLTSPTKSSMDQIEHGEPDVSQLAMASKRKSKATRQQPEDWKPLPSTKVSKEEEEAPLDVKAKNTTRPLKTKPPHVSTPMTSNEKLNVEPVTSRPRRFSIDEEPVADLPIRKRIDDPAPPATSVKRSLPKLPPVKVDKETVSTPSVPPVEKVKRSLPKLRPVTVDKETVSTPSVPPAKKVKRFLPKLRPVKKIDKETVSTPSEKGGWTVLPMTPSDEQKTSRPKSSFEKSHTKKDDASVPLRKTTASRPKQRPPIRVRRSGHKTEPSPDSTITKVKPVRIKTSAKPNITGKPKLKPRKMGGDPVKQPPNVEASLPPVVPKVSRHSSRRVVRRPGKTTTDAARTPVEAPTRKTIVDDDKLIEELRSVVGPDAVKQADFPKVENIKTAPVAVKATTSSRNASRRLVSELPAQTPKRKDPTTEESTRVNGDDMKAPPPLK